VKPISIRLYRYGTREMSPAAEARWPADHDDGCRCREAEVHGRRPAAT
jgi:hypothetical protein